MIKKLTILALFTVAALTAATAQTTTTQKPFLTYCCMHLSYPPCSVERHAAGQIVLVAIGFAFERVIPIRSPSPQRRAGLTKNGVTERNRRHEGPTWQHV